MKAFLLVPLILVLLLLLRFEFGLSDVARYAIVFGVMIGGAVLLAYLRVKVLGLDS